MNPLAQRPTVSTLLSPRLPLELERFVFELAAHRQRSDIPRFIRVAWRVKEWLEPVLYQFLLATAYSIHYLPPQPVHRLPRIRTEKLLSLISTKSPPFCNSVQRLLLNLDVERHAQLFYLVILAACSQLTELYFLSRRCLNSAYLPRLCELNSLHRLAVDAPRLFHPNPVDYGSSLFRNITHFELLSYCDPDTCSGIGEELAHAPSLTHIAFHNTVNIPAIHACVRANSHLTCILFRSNLPIHPHIRPLSPDVRMVCMPYDNLVLSWFRGVTSGHDHWAAADEFIAAKRAGKIDPSVYFTAPEPDFRDELNGIQRNYKI
ncbi:hypothetical protein R3P38DRAFT_2857190 [Favolaschia claudopus]|uniref:F-box protein n=1 Tax=Favolaschia claudopus TaxID=2862362 RepID=A0AAW0DIG5_9AGAR